MKIVLDEKIIAEILSDKYELSVFTSHWRGNLQVGWEIFLVQINNLLDLKYFPGGCSIFAACPEGKDGHARKFADWLKKEYPEVFI